VKLIVGLGNPGIIYANSRHNIGFQVVKSLVRKQNCALKRDKFTLALSAKIKAGNQNILLALPLTFMNLSGLSVKALVEKYKIDLQDLLVVCDDLDLEFGRLKLRARGSSGGHRGLESIIDTLASEEFCRLRIGIGRPHAKIGASRFVLTRFKRSEKQKLNEMLSDACGCCLAWAAQGVEKTMNLFNRKLRPS